jgi:hypothetical protein
MSSDYGVSFRLTITTLYKPLPMTALYAMGYRYLLDSDSPWFPSKEQNLTLT